MRCEACVSASLCLRSPIQTAWPILRYDSWRTFESHISRNARICGCMRRGRPQTGRAWCCGLHGRTLKSRRSQRYVGGEHRHDQGRVRTTKLLGEKHAPNVPQELRTPRDHGQSSPFLVRHGGRASPHRCRRVHVGGEGVGVRTVRNTTFYVSIAISLLLLFELFGKKAVRTLSRDLSDTSTPRTRPRSNPTSTLETDPAFPSTP